jgi:hypothetical protein
MLESSRGDDLKDPARPVTGVPVTGVPKRVPLVTGVEDEIHLLRIHDLISELRSHAPFKDVAVLVLVSMTVKWSSEGPRGDRMLHKGKPTTGFLTPNHEPNPKRAKVDSFPVVGPEDAWALRGLEAMRVGSCRIIGRRYLFHSSPPSSPVGDASQLPTVYATVASYAHRRGQRIPK